MATQISKEFSHYPELSMLQKPAVLEATSVDAERLFSFSGGTVSKLRNQLSEHSAHAAVMVGQWAGHPDLIAAKVFEAQLVEGWLRKKKRKADVPADGQSAPKVIVIADDGVD
ncbi:hypothetical protein B0H13DRAFT_1922638 [Mycena leptocephala]|nr:hypothetical protein B0H13DRAFT_1922638 [Mycena leptocephala]